MCLQTANKRSGDGTLRTFCPVPFKNGTFPEDLGLPAITCIDDIFDLNDSDLKRYLEGHGHPPSTERRQLVIEIGVAESLWPDVNW